MLIRIDNLTKTFGTGKDSVTALQDVSLEVEERDIFGIIGMSGAGKSTLLRCLCMLETPSHGEIYLDGKAFSSLSAAERRQTSRQLGVVFQGYHLLMQKNVFQNIAFPMLLAKDYNKQQIEHRVLELLRLVGLEEKAAAYPSQLSGGQMQRVALARALATSPKVLLCDEPTSALDSLTTKNVMALLRDINQKLGVTIIIITHEISVVKALCKHVAVIDDSRFVEVGPQQEVFTNPKSDITRLLLGIGEVAE